MMIHRLLFLLSFLAFLSPGHAQVVINEIFYNSPADLDRLEFVELHNPTATPADLSGWRFSKGIDYEFPQGTSIEGGAFLVLCADAALFKRLYEIEANGVFKKGLDNGGETLTLKNADGKKADSVKYDDEAPWPKSPDGYSASLERICPTEPGNNAANWAPSILSDNYDAKPSGTPGLANSVFAKTLAPVIEEVSFGTEVVAPNVSVSVRARVSSAAKVALLYRIATPGAEGEESTLPMQPDDDGQYTATIPGQEANQIIRFRVQVTDNAGAVRLFPHPNEIRPALSVYVDGNFEAGQIPVAHFFNIGKAEHEAGAAYRTGHARSRGGGGFDRGRRERREPTEEERLRSNAEQRLSEDALEKAWAKLTLEDDQTNDHLRGLAKAFDKANTTLTAMRSEAGQTKELHAFSESLSDKLADLRKALDEDTASLLSDDQRKAFAAIGEEEQRRDRGRGFGNPGDMLPRIFNVEESWFRSAMSKGVSGDQLAKLADTHREAIAKRNKFAEELADGGDIDFRAVFGDAGELSRDLNEAVGKVLTKEQFAPLDRSGGGRGIGGPDRRGRGGSRGRSSDQGTPLRPQGRSAFIYTDPETQKPQLFDFVNITQRKSGYKVRLHKDKPLNGLTTLNVLFESNEATTLNEALAYELYRQAGNATAQAGFLRVLIDGQIAGYHLWFEQPNGSFFRRHEIDDKGNLYKLIWMGSHRPSKYTPEDKMPERMDIVGKHEKKTNPHDGYDDIISLIETLEESQGDDGKMWQLIQDHFEVDQVINYFASNALLSHWDGFFNNYFLYHDVKGSGKWTMYPWDQDSTWSLRMGNAHELSTMPINFGAEGARPPGAEPRRDGARDRRGRGGFGGGRGAPGWWRDGGDISRPLLANPQFYQRFKARLKVLSETVFTDDNFGPKIDAVAKSIEPEVRLRAETFDRDPEAAARDFQDIMTRMREHMKLRTAFILEELGN